MTDDDTNLARLLAETRRLDAEANKLLAEERKLAAEELSCCGSAPWPCEP